ncbi:hypothetical protein DY000_02041135 [Brassica cretica]|uniref:Uncharacterized protein n=1 Tax=Brassica cretica TaxID=69181 RepID=A0ABQ7BA53_BRACR|nr:hypothetical protein DY000_02041135 [Brassica cretica]
MAEEAPLPSFVATSQPVESYEPPAKESLWCASIVVQRIQHGLRLLTAYFSASIAQAMAEEAPLPSFVATSQPVESYEPPAKESLCDAEPIAEACAQLTQEFFKGDTLCCLITSLQYLNLEARKDATFNS